MSSDKPLEYSVSRRIVEVVKNTASNLSFALPRARKNGRAVAEVDVSVPILGGPIFDLLSVDMEREMEMEGHIKNRDKAGINQSKLS